MKENIPSRASLAKWVPAMIFCAVFLSMVASEAHALPQFTRQYELKCSQCHLAPPTINYTGRRFLVNGYRFFREERDNQTIQTINNLLNLDRTIPLGVWVSSQPYENTNGDQRVRPFHEARLYIGGGLYKDISGFVRWDLQQEADYKFVSRVMTFHYSPSDLLNVHISWASVTFHDINDTLHPSRQLTLKQNAVLRQPFGGADNHGALASPRPGIHATGWLTNHVFYMLGYSGHAQDTNVHTPATVSGRLAVEVRPVTGYDSFVISAGGFGIHGFKTGSRNREFDRLIGDLQMDIPLINLPVPFVIRLMGAYVWAKDDVPHAEPALNRAWYAQALVASMRKGEPKWVPIVRVDEYSTNDGTNVFREVTLNLTYYVVENFRAQLEHWRQMDVPADNEKDRSLVFRLVYLY